MQFSVWLHHAKQQLQQAYSKAEAQALAQRLLLELLDLSLLQLRTDSRALTTAEVALLAAGLHRLLQHEPLQHIVGTVEFANCKLKVSPQVLIPRPETEELVELIISRYQQQPPQRLLDICTGSGCIAIALAKAFSQAEVAAVDVSAEALEVAEENAALNKVSVDFWQQNVLRESIGNGKYELIISNPPYVRELERVQMQANVLEYEPELALFVADTDPLLFYRTIVQHAQQLLATNGCLYFEINEAFAEETADLLREAKFSDVEIIQDFRQRPRFVCGRR